MIRHSVAFLALTACAASAQDLGTPVFSSQSQGPALGFTLRGGVESAPSYFGAEGNEAGPTFSGELNYLRLGGFTFGNPDPLFVPTGLGAIGSFRYIGERDDDDDSELRGLDDVDASLEIGGGLRYATRDYQIFGVVRYGAVGHESFVGELGADVFVRPSDRLTLSVGPRALFGDDDYASTYFGVTEAESIASGGNFDPFDADGGLLSSGIEFGAGYRLNENWGVDAAVTYEKLRNDAADSPISADDEQFKASIGVTRRFTLGF
ncbi:MipA/OmpV family protein [Jannaschia sp. S6380]|uniref:MipA/OmpV family protein n=1 Tax=Jannaschia sp. S6380 TaxID=2926408 RepID=UPI001FF65DE3|nr:MipA/OmpV family protein [Jannaschia sp. S6380]MCK0167786.1 MipA/OmpV family protein [Jannaschia sp. S6380]